MNRIAIGTAGLAIALSTTAAHAALLVEVNFDDGTTTPATAAGVDATFSKDSNYSITNQSDPSIVGGSNWIGVNRLWNGQPLASGRWIQIDVSAADPSQPLNLTQFSWEGRNGGVNDGAGAYDYTAAYSTDGGANWIELASGRDSTSGWALGNLYEVELTGDDFTDVQDIAFRITVYNGNNGQWRGLDDLQLDGTVVPEPASLALLGAGLLALRRRR